MNNTEKTTRRVDPEFNDCVNCSTSIYYSHGISSSDGIRESTGISDSDRISFSHGIGFGHSIDTCYGIGFSSGISNSEGIYDTCGISYSSGVVHSLFCKNMHGAADCIFCVGLKGAATLIFNKKVTKKRLKEVRDKLLGFGWKPDFTTASKLKKEAGGEWAKTPASAIRGRREIKVYSEMPPEMLGYIKSLPEYDPEIFEAITGLEGKK